MDNRVFQCYYPGCITVFSTKFNLVRHLNTRHIQILSFPCKACGKVLSSKASLQSHQRIHSGEDEPAVVEDTQAWLSSEAESEMMDPLSLPKVERGRQYSGKLPICSKLLKKVVRRFS